MGKYAEDTAARVVPVKYKAHLAMVKSYEKFLCFAQESGDLRTGGGLYCGLLEYGETIHKLTVIFRSKGSNVLCVSGPLHPTGFNPFVEQKESIAIPYKSFESILLPSAEKEKDIFLKRIQTELLLYDRGKAIDPSSEIGTPAGYIDLFKAVKIP